MKDVLLGTLACVLLGRTSHLPAAAVVPTQISQVPLTIAVPAHPQVVLAVGNSESMDGNLSGAIMTGSGSLPAAMNLLQNSSSSLSSPSWTNPSAKGLHSRLQISMLRLEIGSYAKARTRVFLSFWRACSRW